MTTFFVSVDMGPTQPNWSRGNFHATAMVIGAGEFSATALWTLCISTSASRLLATSLFAAGPSVPLASLVSLTLLTPFVSFSPFSLFSLFSLSSLFSLLLPAAETAAEAEADSSVTTGSGSGLGGAVHRGISHTVPVKLLSLKPPFAHFRQGLPERSRARRPAFMAP